MLLSSSGRCRKPRQNLFIIGDAILPQTGTKLTEKRGSKLALCCGAIWRHREKPQYRCTTTIHPVYNCPKRCWKNYFLYDFWCAQTYSFRAVFGLPIRNLTLAVSQGSNWTGTHRNGVPVLFLKTGTAFRFIFLKTVPIPYIGGFSA